MVNNGGVYPTIIGQETLLYNLYRTNLLKITDVNYIISYKFSLYLKKPTESYRLSTVYNHMGDKQYKIFVNQISEASNGSFLII